MKQQKDADQVGHYDWRMTYVGWETFYQRDNLSTPSVNSSEAGSMARLSLSKST